VEDLSIDGLDRVDRDIIKLLQYDGRMSFTEIAGRIGVSDGTIRRRIHRLTESGIMQVVAVVEPEYVGWGASAMVAVNVQGERIDSTAKQIAQLPEVSYLFMASGEFDLFVEVLCRNRQAFVSFLTEKLQQVPGVRQTRTFMILKMYKLSYRWGESTMAPQDEVV